MISRALINYRTLKKKKQNKTICVFKLKLDEAGIVFNFSDRTKSSISSLYQKRISLFQKKSKHQDFKSSFIKLKWIS